MFLVRVPVLSEQRTSTPASSSIASRRETMAFFFASAWAPKELVTVITVGMATGMEAISNTSTMRAMSARSAHCQAVFTTMSW